jgi:hypothetical protein
MPFEQLCAAAALSSSPPQVPPSTQHLRKTPLAAAAVVLCLQELMQQASWNLCPQDIQYNADCYDDPDNKFASSSGSLTKYMPDLPDGDWSLMLKKDIFQKVWNVSTAATTSSRGMIPRCSSTIRADSSPCRLITV